MESRPGNHDQGHTLYWHDQRTTGTTRDTRFTSHDQGHTLYSSCENVYPFEILYGARSEFSAWSILKIPGDTL